MKRKTKIFAAVLSAVLTLSGTAAYAQSTPPQNDTSTVSETVLEDNRTLTEKGNATLIDDVSDNENLQFITVTSKDGNTFYFIIDKGANSENVYFLNTVDDSDLMALAENGDMLSGGSSAHASSKETDKEKDSIFDEEQEETEKESVKPDEKEVPEKKSDNSFLIILLVLLGLGGAAAYYFKALLPKKKLSEADDIDDYEFVDENDEETVVDDDTDADDEEDTEDEE